MPTSESPPLGPARRNDRRLGDGAYAYLLDPGAQARPVRIGARPATAAAPVVSCIMASRGVLHPAVHAIACFRRQSHAQRELVIATAAVDGRLADYVADLDDERIRIVRVDPPATVGRLRNVAIAASQGDLVCIWDDDDLSHPERIALQLGVMRGSDAAGCFLGRLLLWWPDRRRIAVSGARIWENTMLAARSLLPPYREDGLRGEDTEVVLELRRSRRLVLSDVPEAYCYVAHGANLVGADHFEMLLAGATRTFEGDEHDAVIAARSASMPFAAYASGVPPR